MAARRPESGKPRRNPVAFAANVFRTAFPAAGLPEDRPAFQAGSRSDQGGTNTNSLIAPTKQRRSLIGGS